MAVWGALLYGVVLLLKDELDGDAPNHKPIVKEEKPGKWVSVWLLLFIGWACI